MESALLNNTARRIAAQSNDEAAGDAIAKQYGIISDQGELQTPEAVAAREDKVGTLGQKLDTYVEQKKAAKAPAEGAAPTPAPAPAAGYREPPSKGTLGIAKIVADEVGPEGYDFVGAAADGIQALANGGLKLANWLDNNIGNGKLIAEDSKFSFATNIFPKIETAQDNFIRSTAQFVMPFMGATKLAGVAGVASRGAQLTAGGAAADFFFREGQDKNLADFVQTMPQYGIPAANFFAKMTSPLAHKEDDNEFVGRLKNMGEGIGLGFAAEGAARAIGFMANLRRGKSAVQRADDFEKGMKPITPEEAVTPAGPIPDKRGQPNVEAGAYSEASDSTKNVIQQMAEKNSDKFSNAMKTISKEELAGKKPLPLDEVLQLDPTKIIEDDVAALSLTHYANQASDRVSELAQAIVKGDTTPETLGKFLEAQEWSAELLFRDSQQGTREGQVLWRRNALLGSEDLQRGAEGELINMHGGGDAIIDDAQSFAKLSPKDQRKVLERSTTKRFSDSLLSVRASNLLWNPYTWLKNEVSNHLTTAVHDFTSLTAPYFPSRKSESLGKEILSLGGTLGKKEAVPSGLSKAEFAAKKQEGARSIFTEYKKLKDVPNPTRKQQAKIDRYDEIIKNMAQSEMMPGEGWSAIRGQASAYADQIWGAFGGLLDSISIEWKAAKEAGKTVTQVAADFEKAGSSKIDFTIAESKNPILNSLWSVQTVPFTILNKRDTFMKVTNYMGDLRQTGSRLARQQGLQGANYSEFVDDFVRNPPGWAGDINSASAKNGPSAKRAERNTFTEDLDDSFSQGLYNLINDSEPRGVRLPVSPLKLQFPFVKTDFNLIKFGIDYSPLAPLTNRYQNAMKAGGADAQMARAQMAVGTMIMGTSVYAASKLNITGYGPNNPKLRKLWLEKNKPYSVNGFELGNFGPIAPLMKAAADMVELAPHVFTDGDVGLDEYSELGGMVAWIAAHYVAGESFTDYMGKFLEDLKTGDMSALTNIASTMVPLTGPAGVINKGFVDEVDRDTRPDPNQDFIWAAWQAAYNRTIEKIPTMSSKLPADKNLWGDEILHPKGFARQTVSPIWGSRYGDDDPVVKEMVKLGDNGVTVHDADEGEHWLAIGMPDRFIKKTIAGIPGIVKLSPEEYSKFVDACAGKDLPEQFSLHGQLKSLIQSDIYKKLAVEQKRIEIKRVIGEMRSGPDFKGGGAIDKFLMENKAVSERLMKSVEAGAKKRGFQK